MGWVHRRAAGRAEEAREGLTVGVDVVHLICAETGVLPDGFLKIGC